MFELLNSCLVLNVPFIFNLTFLYLTYPKSVFIASKCFARTRSCTDDNYTRTLKNKKVVTEWIFFVVN